jgi:hypothetical protein
MPHFVEGLAVVYECCRTIFLTLQCFVYNISYTVDLLSSSVFLSETELMIWYNPFFLQYWFNSC